MSAQLLFPEFRFIGCFDLRIQQTQKFCSLCLTSSGASFIASFIIFDIFCKSSAPEF